MNRPPDLKFQFGEALRETSLLIFHEERQQRILFKNKSILVGPRRNTQAWCAFSGEANYHDGIFQGAELAFYFRTPNSPGPYEFPDGFVLNVTHHYSPAADADENPNRTLIDCGRFGRFDTPPSSGLNIAKSGLDPSKLAPPTLELGEPIKLTDGLKSWEITIPKNLLL